MAHKGIRKFKSIHTASLRIAAAVAVMLLATVSVAFIAPTSASAKPEFAAQTGKPCGTCHQNAAGGGALKPFGEKFKANGNKMPK